MWFHDLSLLRLPADATIDPAELESALSLHPLRSPGPLEFETRGFVSPFSRDDAAFTLAMADGLLT